MLIHQIKEDETWRACTMRGKRGRKDLGDLGIEGTMIQMQACELDSSGLGQVPVVVNTAMNSQTPQSVNNFMPR
jgi:hypothetical protein